jgi:hypothetical protein
VRERYCDFGPSLAAEKLAEHHGCSVSRETLRGWMIAEGLWQDRRHRVPAPHQPRRRRDCLGELVQIDGSEHAWFEDRGPPCTLLAFVDDATSRLMQLRFVTSESVFDYFRTTRAYLEEHGKPVAFYSDKHGIFRVNSKDAAGGDGVTQFGRALLALNIDIICANSPQAKGRIERAFGTLQDRMVKELRLAGVSSIAAANAWLPGFIAAYNTRFGCDPANAKDLHRPLAQADDLDEILAWREERTVTRNLTLHYDRMMLILDPTPLARGLVRKKVEITRTGGSRFSSTEQRSVSRCSTRSRQCSPARSSTTSDCRPYWSRSRRSRPLTRRGSSAGTLRGNAPRTTSRRRDCRQRGGHHAVGLPQLWPEAANSEPDGR